MEWIGLRGVPGLQLTIQSRARLNNGLEMPYLGLGTWESPQGKPTRDTVKYAIDCGYRLIDTAKIYGNEKEVGEGVKSSGVPRDQVFVTTKLWNSDHGYDPTIRAFDESLKRLGLDYIDLYLIHWPVSEKRAETWKAMSHLVKQGKCRSVGVSNYTIRHLRELLESSSLVPVVNQVEFSPFLYQRDLLKFCEESKVQLEAYSPLTRGRRLDNVHVSRIATEHKKSPAQIVLRWAIQHAVIAIPKSIRKERIQENSELFDFNLSAEEMKILDSLNEDFRTCWDPSDIS